MDYKFWATFAINVLAVGLMYWQIRMMKTQIPVLPAPRNAKRLEMEEALHRRLYIPVFVMAGLVLLSWLPFIIAAATPSPLPVFLAGWGGTPDACNALVDTSSFSKMASQDRLFVACRVVDPSVDELEDEKIVVSKPFQITGSMVSILIVYPPDAPIRTVAHIGSQIAVSVFLLPKDRDGANIKRFSDISREGGQILIQGGKLKD